MVFPGIMKFHKITGALYLWCTNLAYQNLMTVLIICENTPLIDDTILSELHTCCREKQKRDGYEPSSSSLLCCSYMFTQERQARCFSPCTTSAHAGYTCPTWTSLTVHTLTQTSYHRGHKHFQILRLVIRVELNLLFVFFLNHRQAISSSNNPT